jgi:hypothetical protein
VNAVGRTALRTRQTSTPWVIRAVAVSLLGLPSLAASSCIEVGYPLATSGTVDVRVDVNHPLFAADSIDDKGQAVLPRQVPFETGVTLSLAEANAPAFGGFVTVRVEPREALALSSDAAQGDAPSCIDRDGSFRCTASRDGLARFVLTSQGNWSGTASLIITWADRIEEKTIEVLPAGLPSTATNFSMIVTGLNESFNGKRLLATYLSLDCSIGPFPDDLGSKWRPGFIRTREAQVRATAPLSTPGVVENAPVIIEALSSEALLSTKADCLDRTTRLRVLLGQTGESDKFFLCFSDIGGPASFAVTSGEKLIEPESTTIQVDAEPRLLRVRALQSVVEAYVPGDLFEVSAFDVNRVGIEMPVDLSVEDDQILSLSKSTITLDGEPNPATAISGTPKVAGTVRLKVTPRLLAMPECFSDPITVVDVP